MSPKERSELNLKFSAIIRASYTPEQIQILVDRARSIERSMLYTVDWGDVRWQG